jgi:cell division septation protein DedD
MRGVFDNEEIEPDQSRRDTELTLGSGTLLAIFFGLVLLCGLCFGLGYAVGRRGSQPPSAAVLQAAPNAQPPFEANDSLPKPPATAQPSGAPASQSAGTGLSPSTASGMAPAAAAGRLPPAAPAASSPAQSQVHPALAPAANPAHSAAAPSVHPAFPPAAPLMVQIAAVANAEDADVLVNALRKRGYAVTLRRDPADNLIHVRIGPFNDRAIADQWRQKLLNDGYNAIVQP